MNSFRQLRNRCPCPLYKRRATGMAKDIRDTLAPMPSTREKGTGSGSACIDWLPTSHGHTGMLRALSRAWTAPIEVVIVRND
jgi:nitrogen-specific signal transduction histidine kinase